MNFRTLYPNYQTFQSKIIDAIQHEYPQSDWCSYDKMLTSWENIYNWMFRSFNYRNLRYNAQQTHFNVQNIFIEELPNFYIKQRIFLEDNFSKLDDITKLGGIEQIKRTLTQNLTGNSKSNFTNSNLVSPQGFVSFTEDMPISQAVTDKNDTTSNTTSKTDSTSDDETSRVNFLEKVIQVSEIKFGFFLKELVGKFDEIFQRFVHLDVSDEDTYLKLKDILIDDTNIEPVFDDKKQKISMELKGISNLVDIISGINAVMETKVNKDFDNIDLNVIVDPDKTNSIKVVNNKLFSTGGSGGTYAGDGNSISISDTNIISAIGLKLKDNKYIKSDDIVTELQQVDDNKKNIETLSGQVEADVKNIGKNKEDIDSLKTSKLGINEIDSKSIIKSNSGKYYVLSMSKPSAQTYYGIDDIMNKDNLSDFVDSSKEDNILQVEGNKLVVIAPKTKWKLVMEPKDFTWYNTDTCFTYIFKGKIKPTSLYKLYYELQPHVQPNFWKGSIELPNFNVNGIVSTTFQMKSRIGNTAFFLIYSNKIMFSTDATEEGNLDIRESKFWIYELEDAMDPIPIPSLPILNRKKYYSSTKSRWQKWRKNDE